MIIKKIFFPLFIFSIHGALFGMEIKLPSETDTPSSDRKFVQLIEKLEPGQLIITRKSEDDKKESWRFIEGKALEHSLSHEGKDLKTPEFYLLLKSVKNKSCLITIKELAAVALYYETHEGVKLDVPERIRNLNVGDKKLRDVQKKGLHKIECTDDVRACENNLYDIKTKRLDVLTTGIEYFSYEDPSTRQRETLVFKILNNTYSKTTGNGIVTYARSKGLFSPYQIERTDIFVNPDTNGKNPNNCAYSFDWNHNALNWRKVIGVSVAAATTAGVLGTVYVKWFKK
ncbi:hypothetical protein HYX58_00515 [Candidatus Dependentiae bacterium]|nr:hypothetical protein [Candidatus Dependentiae bacterium]